MKRSVIFLLVFLLTGTAFSQQLTSFRDKNGKYGFRDSKEKVRVKAVWDAVEKGFAGRYPVKQNDKWGYVDGKGQLVVPPIYDQAIGRRVLKGDKWALINAKGEIVTPFYPALRDMDDSYFAFSKDNLLWGYVDTAGVVKVPMIYRAVLPYDRNITIRKSASGYDYLKPTLLAAVNFRGRIGFIDRENNFVVPPIYKAVKGFDHGFAWVSKDSVLYGAVDANNRLVLPLHFTNPAAFDNDGLSEALLKGIKGTASAQTSSFGVGDKKVVYKSLLKPKAPSAADFIASGYDALYTQNTPDAIRWFTKALDAGEADGAWHLYLLYDTRSDSANYDAKNALKWLQTALTRKSLPAMTEMAARYLEGSGVEKNEASAFRLLKEIPLHPRFYTWMDSLASDDDYELVAYGIKLLGDLYYEGRGTPKNIDEALDAWYTAADFDDSEAMTRIADCHFNGIGVTKDLKKAFTWYEDAAESDPNAMYCLGILLRDGLGTTKNEKEAANWFRQAARFNHEKAKAALAAMGSKP